MGESRRCVVVVVPASLRKQWVQELAEKFFLPSVILETKSFNVTAIKAGVSGNPFDLPADEPAVVVCSYQFAARKAAEVALVPWDLVILDEAHRLRNVFKPGAKTAAGDQDRPVQHTQAAADGDAAPEFPDGAVRTGEHHRRAPLR